MFMDGDLLFSNAQAVTAAAASTNVVDTGPLFTGNTGRDLGVGEDLWVEISVDTTMTDGSSDSTVTVDLQTDTDEAFGSAATVATLMTIPAVSAAGAKWFVKLPKATTVPYERYIRLYYTPNSGNLSAGAFTAALIKDVDHYQTYVSAVSTGVN